MPDPIVRDLSDEDMLRVMADENMQEFSQNSLIEQETIRAVVLAYAEGKIEFNKTPPTEGAGSHSTRYAPSFRKGRTSLFKDLKQTPPYDAEAIATFLGWVCSKG